MKNFDIDQLKDRQLYELPDQFYEKLQDKVLEKTVAKSKMIEFRTKTKYIWSYAVAASFAIILGGTYLFQNTGDVQNSSLATKQVVSEKTSENLNIDPNSEFNLNEKEIAEPTKSMNFAANNKREKSDEISAKDAVIVKNQSKKTIKKIKTEDQIDLLLENFTAEEMAVLANNSDKDLYLDLYN